jgi:putative transposase
LTIRRKFHTRHSVAAVHASVFNHFNEDRRLSSRPHFKANRAAALAEWRGLFAA